MNLRVAVAFLVASLLAGSSASAQPQWHTDVGYIQLLNEFGLVADGSGIEVAQVEAPSGGNFMPNTALAEFSGKMFTQGSPGSALPSSHATNVATSFYGNTGSIAPGVTDITNFEANDWLGNQLGFNSGNDPLAQNFAVSNHSYIGNGLSVADATEILQRYDFAINQSGMVAVVGLNNGSGNPQPQLLAHAYNGITVGLTNGGHSRGTTTFYGAGRTKPDIVAPANTTSIATAEVSSGAAFLYDAAGGGNGTQPEVVKAILMAGATKSEFLTWDRTTTRPLDEVFGAGEMNVYNSYRILAGGESNGLLVQPISASPNEAWDYNPAAIAGTPIFYDLELSAGGKDLSILLDWNIDVIDIDPTAVFNPTTSLADMDLRLYDSTGGFLNVLLDSSLSTVDNVEHIFFPDLAPGRYTIEVRSNVNHDYGIAWRVQAIPEPSQWAALGVAAVVFVWFLHRRRRQKQLVPVPVRKS